MYLYGYYTYYLKGRKKLPKCKALYILKEDLDDNQYPDYNEGRERRNINLENEIKKNVKRKILEKIKDKTAVIITDKNTQLFKIKDIDKYDITERDINRIYLEETLKIKGSM